MLESFNTHVNNSYVGTERDQQIRMKAAADKIRIYADNVMDLRQDAVWDVCSRIRAGTQEGGNLDKAPTVPKFATWCREAETRIQARSRERDARRCRRHSFQKPWVDWREVHRQKMIDERRAFIEEATLDQFKSHASQRQYPPGSTWYWSIQVVADRREARNET